MKGNAITIGILGGGQLARMSAYAAFRMGLRVAILEKTPDSPAAQITPLQLVGAWEDATVMDRFAAVSDVITLENEFIDAAILARLEKSGKPVWPSAATLAAIQDKFIQKETLARQQLPVARYRAVNTVADGVACGDAWGYPYVLKARRNSYDGYGNRTVKAAQDVEAAMKDLGFPQRELYAEAFVPFERELAVMVARGHDGTVRVYPVVETRQQHHICKWVIAPAPVSGTVQQKVRDLAVAAIEAVQGVGIFGVELFATADGTVLVNELAPRPHNTGHYTIEACVTSQFENHVRAVLGWPLGNPDLRVPAAAMVNLLGKRNGPLQLGDLPTALRHDNAKVHIYGKAESRMGRKLGHVTVVGQDAAACLKTGMAVDDALTL